MKLIEWRSLPAETAAALYSRERAHWLDTLGWDTSTIWATVESARLTWGLPGLACLDRDGAVRGWAFFMLHEDRLDVGGIVSDDIATTMALMDGILEKAGGDRAIGGFVCTRAIGLGRVLATRGVASESFMYLVGSAVSTPCASPKGPEAWTRPGWEVRSWQEPDLEEATRLLRRAYGAEGRLFAPHDSTAEWREYLANLVSHTGCGTLAPSLSRVVLNEGRIVALGLISTLGAETAHLVQLAVDPALRGQGIARGLIADALSIAGAAGYLRLSLLVARGNARARMLYRSAGFVQAGQFLSLTSDRRSMVVPVVAPVIAARKLAGAAIRAD